ncbi:MAG: zinc metalloprotease HtpX [Hyphomicrobiaceae bacterium]|nr:zinc metalloprotease HtpX [Hyphomicrobiaceae bacterium]
MPTNFAKTALLLALMTLIFVAMGSAVGGRDGLVVAFLVALVMNALALWRSDSLVLKLHGAQEIGPEEAPGYYGIVRDLAARAELPMPRVCLMHHPQPNAFAAGRGPSSAVVCASTGLLDALTPEEVAGVVAHELAHIRNRDTLTMTVAATIGGAISMLAQWLQFSALFGGQRRNGSNWVVALIAMVVAPFAAMLVQMAISRSREYQADRLGAVICGNPLWLASALARIQELVRGIPNEAAESVPATAHLFIVNPLSGRGLDNFFSTHPSTENRIAELEKLAQEMAAAGTLLPSARGGAIADQGLGGGPWEKSRGPWG